MEENIRTMKNDLLPLRNTSIRPNPRWLFLGRFPPPLLSDGIKHSPLLFLEFTCARWALLLSSFFRWTKFSFFPFFPLCKMIFSRNSHPFPLAKGQGGCATKFPLVVSFSDSFPFFLKKCGANGFPFSFFLSYSFFSLSGLGE